MLSKSKSMDPASYRTTQKLLAINSTPCIYQTLMYHWQTLPTCKNNQANPNKVSMYNSSAMLLMQIVSLLHNILPVPVIFYPQFIQQPSIPFEFANFKKNSVIFLWAVAIFSLSLLSQCFFIIFSSLSILSSSSRGIQQMQQCNIVIQDAPNQALMYWRENWSLMLLSCSALGILKWIQQHYDNPTSHVKISAKQQIPKNFTSKNVQHLSISAHIRNSSLSHKHQHLILLLAFLALIELKFHIQIIMF